VSTPLNDIDEFGHIFRSGRNLISEHTNKIEEMQTQVAGLLITKGENKVGMHKAKGAISLLIKSVKKSRASIRSQAKQIANPQKDSEAFQLRNEPNKLLEECRATIKTQAEQIADLQKENKAIRKEMASNHALDIKSVKSELVSHRNAIDNEIQKIWSEAANAKVEFESLRADLSKIDGTLTKQSSAQQLLSKAHDALKHAHETLQGRFNRMLAQMRVTTEPNNQRKDGGDHESRGGKRP
jgi:chromosome segregation ATPase